MLMLIIVIIESIVFGLSIVFRLVWCRNDKLLFRLFFRGHDFTSSHKLDRFTGRSFI